MKEVGAVDLKKTYQPPIQLHQPPV